MVRGKTAQGLRINPLWGHQGWSGRLSNPDSFIDEVTEEVRRDKLFAFFRRYGWIGVVLALLVVGGAAYREWDKARSAAAAEAYGDALLAAVETPDAAGRKAALEAATTAGDGRQGDGRQSDGRQSDGRIVQALLAAANAEQQGDKATALTALQSLSDDSTVPQNYRDLATLKRVMLAGAGMPAADRIALLQDVATPGRPFRPLALEQIAMVEIETGDTDTGIRHLRDVLQEPLVGQALRSRVSQVIVALGADPAAE